AQIRRQGAAALALDSGTASGKRVIEAEGISKTFDEQVIVRNFSLRVTRGDRLALVGANGAGKTTLLKLLTGELAPDTGSVQLGSGLEMAVFDQNRARLNLDASLWENLTLDPDMRVSGSADQVMVRGQPRHVVGYLKDFLFDESQARAPVRALSGGERARLMLARIMARPSNLLVLDEPTNDLDVETLDLLQDLLGSYDGTVLLVSHDRDFIDRIATATLLMEGAGRITTYAGGWSDMQAQRPVNADAKAAPSASAGPARTPKAPPKPAAEPSPAPAARGLSFTQRHRLDALPAEIDRLTAEIAKLEQLLADPELYRREPVKFARATDMLAQRQQALAAAEEEWLDLAERAEG
ncbi:MAG: ATP-binding cassette domain-containing protein, partial [Pararhodobacter sp.]|nr:ATP-binding cassette domain-containing protein [Pararhodobacter sp.]